MNRILCSFLLTATIAISSVESVAQNDLLSAMRPKPVPPSPNVAALGKYGDYQVGHYTGIPEISIPLFEAKSGNLVIPISINYHASGIRPTDVASYVGLGWSLSAGGQVTCSVNGESDDEHYLDYPLNPSPSSCYSLDFLKSAARGHTEPDVFGYAYPGRSGKFMLPNAGPHVNDQTPAPKGLPYLFPYAPIIVKRIDPYKWEIIDEKGILYRFGRSELGTQSYARESSHSWFGGSTPINAITAWNLMDVVAPNSNDVITLTYQDFGQVWRKDYSTSYLVRDIISFSHFEDGQNYVAPTHGQPDNKPIDVDVNQMAPKEIVFENGKIEFFKSSSPRSDHKTLFSLDKIVVSALVNGTYIPQKTIKFLYSYFKDENQGNVALKLDEVQLIDKVGYATQKYKFKYFTDSFSWNPTNQTFWFARDLWGYFNGAYQNTDLLLRQYIPYQATSESTPGSEPIGGAYNREVNSLYIKEGVLKKIEFPTGGYTEFDYESNKYLNTTGPTSVERTAGGLRVKRIVSTESATGIPVVKTYKYGSGESGHGVSLFTQDKFSYESQQTWSSDCQVTQVQTMYRQRSFHANAVLNYESQSPVVYPVVTEYLGDPVGVTNGKIVYTYDGGNVALDFTQMMPGSTKVYYNSYAWSRGKLTKKMVYAHGSSLPVSATDYSYSTYKSDSRRVGLLAFEVISGNASCVGNYRCSNDLGIHPQQFVFTFYDQGTGVHLQSSVTETTYEPGGTTKFFSRSTTNSYDSEKLQVTQTSSSVDRTGERLVTVFTYPFQLTANAQSTGSAKGIYMLNQKNILSAPIETYSYVQRTNGTNRRIVSAQVTTFKPNGANANHVVPDQIYTWESANRASSYTPIVVNGSNNGLTFNSNQKLRVTLSGYDVDGNILAVEKTNDVPVGYKWGYNNALPIAEITNSLPKNVFHTSFEEETTNFFIGGKTGNKSRSNASEYSQALSLLDPGAYILAYYKWETNKWRYYETPATVPGTGLYTITLPAAQYDEIRFFPKGAQLTTYTYDPLLGIKTMTDPNGITTYYDHDSFGRLNLIRDNNDHVLKTYEYLYKILN